MVSIFLCSSCIFAAAWIHGSGFSKYVLSNPQQKRLILYLALTFNKPSWSQDQRHRYLENVGQMLPVQAFALHQVDDNIQLSLEEAIVAAKSWISKACNSSSIRCAASWLINHKVSPIVQRGFPTLQSVLAEGIMKLALKGIPIEEYPSKFNESLFVK
jgi:hypothetical protein